MKTKLVSPARDTVSDTRRAAEHPARGFAFGVNPVPSGFLRDVPDFPGNRPPGRALGRVLADPAARRFGGFAARLLGPLLLIAAAAATFLTAARDEDFLWADGASFALNGELVRDYLASGLGQSPMAFALEWFRHYPAVTISLYPPIFPLAEAAVFAVFGFSHATAVATVTLFVALAACGMYRMMRTAVGIAAATGAGLMLLGTPEVLRWSREVVMDVPSMAFLLLAAAALLHYQATKRSRALLAAVVWTLAAVYTKQTAIFVAPAFAAVLLADEGWAFGRRKSTWIFAATGVLGIVPLVLFTVFYAPVVFHIAVGTGTGQREYARLSWQALIAYGAVLPDIVGIVPLTGAAGYLAWIAARGWRDIAERRLTLLMLAWFVTDYLMISVTADFETRYATLLTVPPVALSVLLLTRLFAARWAASAALAAGAGLFAVLLATQPVFRVEGYGDIAQYVLEHTKPGETVLFHGVDSKNFTFCVRARSPEPRIFIMRAEKSLVDYSIVRDWGITDRNVSAAEMASLIDRNNVSYVVFQPNFWTDQPSIATLQRMIDSERFALVAQFGITSEDPSRSKVLRVYRVEPNLTPAPTSGR
jgi:4-amino-4-deoxy-L-arabinose transferase-like glycosyltransferase